MTGSVGDAEAAGRVPRRDPGAPGGNHDRQSEGVPDYGGDAAGNQLPEFGAGTALDVRGGLAARAGRRAPPTGRGRLSAPSRRLRNGVHLTTLHALAREHRRVTAHGHAAVHAKSR
jgi:hypothetical protein